jgi:hypothetical protein
MKARSVIFTHQQAPMTIFGIPPLMAGLSMVAGVIMYLVTLLLGLLPISLITGAIVAIVGLFKAYRLGRRDKHVESVFLTAFAFWGFSSHRGLLTGACPQRSHGGRS